ncbi:hypothetical protein AB4508_20505 [Vibrio splendidus]
MDLSLSTLLAHAAKTLQAEINNNKNYESKINDLLERAPDHDAESSSPPIAPRYEKSSVQLQALVLTECLVCTSIKEDHHLSLEHYKPKAFDKFKAEGKALTFNNHEIEDLVLLEDRSPIRML